MVEGMDLQKVGEAVHTLQGKFSIVFGILGLISGRLFISIALNLSPSLVYVIEILPFLFAILAIVLGYLARKRNDSLGLIGIILGVVAILLAIVQLFIVMAVYTYVTNMMPSTT